MASPASLTTTARAIGDRWKMCSPVSLVSLSDFAVQHSLYLCRSLSFFLTIPRTLSLASHSKTVYRLLGLDGPDRFAADLWRLRFSLASSSSLMHNWIVSFNSLCFLTASASLMRNWLVLLFCSFLAFFSSCRAFSSSAFLACLASFFACFCLASVFACFLFGSLSC